MKGGVVRKLDSVSHLGRGGGMRHGGGVGGVWPVPSYCCDNIGQ